MAPMLLSNICKLPHQHQEIILRIATKVCPELSTFGITLSLLLSC